MKSDSFQIVIEKESEDESYFAYSPNAPGCLSNGETIEEARGNIREALEQHLPPILERSDGKPGRLEGNRGANKESLSP